jgi:hypothetical protein
VKIVVGSDCNSGRTDLYCPRFESIQRLIADNPQKLLCHGSSSPIFVFANISRNIVSAIFFGKANRLSRLRGAICRSHLPSAKTGVGD